MNTPPGMLCDHRDHNTLDNRKQNLRNCTHAQNNLNTRVRSDNKLGIRGIRKVKNGYYARVHIYGKIVLSKQFPTLEEAITARKEAVLKYHGEFAHE